MYIVPSSPGIGSHFFLLVLLRTEQGKHTLRDGQDALLSVFRRGKVILPALLLLLPCLLTNGNRSIRKVNAVPGQAQKLALPHTGKEGNFIKQFMRVPIDHAKKRSCGIIIENRHLFPDDLRQTACVSRILPNISIRNRLLKCFVQNSMDILDCLRRERFCILFAWPQQIVVERLDLLRLQRAQLDCTEVWRQIQCNAAIEIGRGGLNTLQIIVRPALKPLRNGHGRRLNI